MVFSSFVVQGIDYELRELNDDRFVAQRLHFILGARATCRLAILS